VAISGDTGVVGALFHNSSTGQAYVFAPDVTPPETMITAGPSGTIATRTAVFSWTGSDDVTATGSLVYAFRLHPLELTFSPFGSATTKTYTGLNNGAYTFFVKARDQAGNKDLTPASRSFTVSAPSRLVALGPAKVWVGRGSLASGSGSTSEPRCTFKGLHLLPPRSRARARSTAWRGGPAPASSGPT